MSVLEVKNLSVYFHTREGVTKAVDDVSFNVDEGEILAIVGESGSGKSVTCYSFLGLIPCPPGKIESGQALYSGQDLLHLNNQQLNHIRGNEIAVIFQDPMTSLNPYLSIGEQLIEPLVYHRGLNKKQAKIRAVEVLNEVGITDAEQRFDNFPHEFSGGMRQRVMIAMALINEPKLLICDEPTTALDVTIQKQILLLIKGLQDKYKLSVIFISHDLAVVSDIAHRVMVMKDGQMVETNQTQALFKNPQHCYTQKLIAAIPQGKKPFQAEPNEKTLIEVENLKVWFKDHSRKTIANKLNFIKAVDDVSFNVNKNEILGLVGESGSGKSTIGRALLRLLPITAGGINFDGQAIDALKPKELKPWRKRMQMIFQDPYASLNPRMTVFQALAEPLLYHHLADKKSVTLQVLSLMDDVGLAQSAIRKYPHEFSGGQRQRIAIGRAIATKPEFIVADEPVSALDVTIQAQILDLILELVKRHNLTMLFISHDLSVVRYLADRTAVIHHGKLVETNETEALWQAPQQPYTQQLLSAISTL